MPIAVPAGFIHSLDGGATKRNPALFKPKTPHWQLQSAARVIQAVVRLRLRMRFIEAAERGSAKLYVQKHASKAMEGAAVLLQAAYRRNNAVRQKNDIKDERAVDEYNRSRGVRKQPMFKPRYPPSYYRSAAAFIQHRIGPESSTRHRLPGHLWEQTRKSYRTAHFGQNFRGFNNPYRDVPIVFKPVLTASQARTVRGMALERTESMRRAAEQVEMLVGAAPLVMRSGAERSSEQTGVVPVGMLCLLLETREEESGAKRALVRFEPHPDEPATSGWVTARLADGTDNFVVPPEGWVPEARNGGSRVPNAGVPVAIASATASAKAAAERAAALAAAGHAPHPRRSPSLAVAPAASPPPPATPHAAAPEPTAAPEHTAAPAAAAADPAPPDDGGAPPDGAAPPAAPVGSVSTTPVEVLVAEDAMAAAATQQAAEDAFFLADTSGDGLVDEGELVVLIMQLLSEPDEAKVQRYVASLRPDADVGLVLDFDQFVEMYNSFATARARGEI